MDELDFNYDFHDLRHTFITKAISAYPPRDVQLAAGHKSIETTMRYAHDNRNLDDEVFNPEEIAS
jgi:integrase